MTGFTQARFIYGLVGFILVAALINMYDESHGTGYLWAYTFIIGAGLAVAHSDKLGSGLAGISAAVGQAAPTGGVAKGMVAP